MAASNTFGTIFTLTSFGESHGPAIGGVVDGMPAGVFIDEDFLQEEMDRRRPGSSDLTTSRSEADRVRILSGVFESISTGAPIGFVIENTSQRPSDYENMRHLYRPGHADYTYQAKYCIRDHRGGGRSSARETAVRVAAGAIAKMVLEIYGIYVEAWASQIGTVKREGQGPLTDEMRSQILEARSQGDTLGGIVSCRISGCPAGLGDPVFGKLSAKLASAMLSINAAHGFDYGMGFDGAAKRGSEVVDNWVPCAEDPREIKTTANNSGGIQGGISNGEPIEFRVAFKPVATLMRDVETVDDEGKATILHARGRHDPCVVPRAIPVVEAMAAMVVLDAFLLDRAARS
ncbi:MAG: chorismate synthase [Muribaculaceae bacterium]